MASLKSRLLALERRLMNLLPLWPGDGDNFLEALGISGPDMEKFKRKNPDGSTGYDDLAVLNALAPDVWRDDP